MKQPSFGNFTKLVQIKPQSSPLNRDFLFSLDPGINNTALVIRDLKTKEVYGTYLFKCKIQKGKANEYIWRIRAIHSAILSKINHIRKNGGEVKLILIEDLVSFGKNRGSIFKTAKLVGSLLSLPVKEIVLITPMRWKNWSRKQHEKQRKISSILHIQDAYNLSEFYIKTFL